MKNKMYIQTSPQIKAPLSTQKIMLMVILALLPALVCGIIIFGISALWVTLITVATCVLSEYLFNICRYAKTKSFAKQLKQPTVLDLSSVVTGLILAMNLPANAAWYVCVLGGVFAIVIVKMMFGGIGRNFANPAATARVMLFIAFGLMAADTLNGASGATWLSTDKTVIPSIMELFLGNKASAAFGEVSALALLVGGLFLIAMRIVDWKIPTIFIGTFAVMILIFSGFDFSYTIAHILSGGLILGAFFMASDYSTSPNTKVGVIIYAVGLGLLTALIREFGSYPEGVSLAIVFMNIIVPLLDKYIVPKPFGYVAKKEVK